MDMKELTKEDLEYVVMHIPKDVLSMMNGYPLFIGGGFIRSVISGEKVSDIDVFGPTQHCLEAAAGYLREMRGAQCKKHLTKNAITIITQGRTPIQFITRWVMKKPEELIDSFDYTICQCVVWREYEVGWKSLIGDRFYQDLAAKRLFYTSPIRSEDAGGSIMRMRKFLNRGYNIQVSSMARVIARLMCHNPVQVTTEDETAKAISGLLYEVDPLRIIDGLEPRDEHVGKI